MDNSGTGAGNAMEEMTEIGLLLDFYGALLTPHARELMRMYLEEDLSLQEIAEASGVSRQAVHDSVSRGEKQLMEYEERLGLLKRFDALRLAAANFSKNALSLGFFSVAFNASETMRSTPSVIYS